MSRLSVFVLCSLLGACAQPRLCDGPARTLYVVSHGWHSGIVVERDALVQRLPALATELPELPHVEVGWGEARFYPARDTNALMAFRAVLWRNDSVLHVVPFAHPPGSYFPQVKELRTDEAGYAATVDVIAASFKPGLQRLAPSLYGNGGFYPAEGKFHLFNTCNDWVERALEAGRCESVRGENQARH